ncbi:MAG: MaoC family dehydratase N-terminal domain-containing protein [Candidatus Rokubacteria bacterium]|nr:MaoC family dehydratase N-terminal domain-containing protein [Candidatus Rokubacteria bacterium]
MRLPAGLVGAVAGPQVREIDARWLMAYAAGLGETAPPYVDTLRSGGLLAHPLFPVCYEWPVALALRATLPDEVAVRGVHATHDLHLHRLPRVGDRLATAAAVVSVTPRRPGAFVVTRFLTADGAGRPVSTTEYGTLYRGVECDAAAVEAGNGEPAETPELPARADPAWSEPLSIPANLAHVYTECARIWNPIHTDRAVARAAGLPDVILHGTATLGLAVSAVLRREADGDPTRVRRLTGRFGAMILLPSALTVQGLGAVEAADGRWVGFQVLTAGGRPAVRDGRILLTG